MSLAAALTPLGKAATRKERRRWVVNVSAYSLAGTVSSALVGAALGGAGSVLPSAAAGSAGVAVAVAVALAAILRESGMSRIPLLESRRATPGAWARNLRGPVVPALWGFDLGLFFTTFFTFAGPWLLVVIAVASGSAAFGITLLVAYWLGRTLSVWLAPLFVPDATATPQMTVAFTLQRRQFQLVHATALTFMAAVLVGMFLSSTPL